MKTLRGGCPELYFPARLRCDRTLRSAPDRRWARTVDHQGDQKADIARRATVALSPSVTKRRCLGQASQVSGELVSVCWSRHGGRHHLTVNIAQRAGSAHPIAP